MFDRYILDAMENPILITDSNMKIIYVNKSFQEYTGYTLLELLHKEPKFFSAKVKSQEFYQRLKSKLAKDGRWHGEIWNKRKNGEIFFASLTITAVRDDENKVINYIGFYKETREREMRSDETNRLKMYDLLTGLPNLEALKEVLSKEIEVIGSNRDKHFLLSIRMKNYSELAISYGYEVIDEIIFNMAERIKLISNEIGVLFRIGKEDFVILCELNEDEESIESFVEKLNDLINIGFSGGDEVVFVNIITGILPITDRYNDVNQVIEDTNLLVDWAYKENIENYIYYSDSIKEKFQKEVKMETLLRSAIDNKELYLLYQPQFSAKTGTIIGVEALLRWRSREFGEVLPYIFIPMAERIGIIDDIGKWVLKEACKQNKKWQDKLLPKIPVSVNLSPIQFRNKDIINSIKKALQDCKLEGKYLGIEITESSLVDDIKVINEKLIELRKMGIKVSIDDFGTGYSSLGYLRDLKFDYIKIDREFIKDFPDSDNGAIARIILNLCRELGINSVAEGVETKEQLEFISDNGGNAIQGYYYSPPVDSEEIERHLIKSVI